jgi:hypothetical protein
MATPYQVIGLEAYLQYKRDTRAVIEFLSRHSRSSSINIAAQTIPRAKLNARARNHAWKERKKPSQPAKYAVKISQFIPLAEAVAKSDPPPTTNTVEEIIPKLARQIRVRTAFSDWYIEYDQEDDVESNKRHNHIIRVLERTLEILKGLMIRLKTRSAPLRALQEVQTQEEQTSFTNIFENLEYDAIGDDEEQLPSSDCILHKPSRPVESTQAIHTTATVISESSNSEDLTEIAFRSYCLLNELAELRGGILEVWKQYLQGETDLVAAAATINTAMIAAQHAIEICLPPEECLDFTRFSKTFRETCASSDLPQRKFGTWRLDTAYGYLGIITKPVTDEFLNNALDLISFGEDTFAEKVPAIKTAGLRRLFVMALNMRMCDRISGKEFQHLDVYATKLLETLRENTEIFSTTLVFGTQVYYDMLCHEVPSQRNHFQKLVDEASEHEQMINMYLQDSTQWKEKMLPELARDFESFTAITSRSGWDSTSRQWKPPSGDNVPFPYNPELRFLSANPVQCGLKLLRWLFPLRDSASNSFDGRGTATPMVHLYNVLLQQSYLPSSAARIENLIEIHGSKIIFGGSRPKEWKEYYSSLYRANGNKVSPQMARSRQNQLPSDDAWSSRLKSHFIAPAMDLIPSFYIAFVLGEAASRNEKAAPPISLQILELSTRANEQNERWPILGEDKEAKIRIRRTISSTLPIPLGQLPLRLSRTLEQELKSLCFNYLKLRLDLTDIRRQAAERMGNHGTVSPFNILMDTFKLISQIDSNTKTKSSAPVNIRSDKSIGDLLKTEVAPLFSSYGLV